MTSYQRSYAFAGNGVAFTCMETSSEPLPPPAVPGVGVVGAVGDVVAQLAVEPSGEARAAAIERARAGQLQRAEIAATAARTRAVQQAERQARALEQAARFRPALEAGR